MAKAKRIGDLQLVDNTKRKFGSNKSYFFVRLQLPNKEEIECLFTENDILKAQARAKKNPEDLLVASKIRDLLD